MATTWAPESSDQKYRLLYQGAPTPADTELTAVASPHQGEEAAAQPWSPRNPLFWFAAIAAATFGLMGFSTSVRVGKATGTVALGQGK